MSETTPTAEPAAEESGDIAALARGGRTNFLGFLLRLAARLPFLFIAGRLYGPTALGRFASALVIVELLAIDRAGNPSATYLYPLVAAGRDTGCGCGAGSPDGGAPALLLVLAALTRASSRCRSRRSAP